MNFTYSGKWGVQKEEYNLYYMRDRYYSSELHRFLSLDKDQGDLYRPSTLNPYAYVGNNPINFIDPSGMTAVNIANALKNAVINEDGSLNLGGIFELGKFALSFTPVGWIVDLYDLGQSILAFDWTWGGLADIGLNVVGLIPGVGDLAKASKLGKNAIKTVDAVADVTDGLNDARKAIKRADALVDARKAAKNVGHGVEAFDDSSKVAKNLNKGSDAVDTANDAGKTLKNADEVGSATKAADGSIDAAKVYTSTSPYVGEIATNIEKEFPNKIVGFERKIYRPNGSTLTDFDIELDNLIIEVKSSKGKEFTEQLDRILSAAGDKPVVVYGSKLKKTYQDECESQKCKNIYKSKRFDRLYKNT